MDQFTLLLIAETLFYDAEYGALGNLSLIDTEAARERYIASYVPDEDFFMLEEASDWEDYEPSEDDEIGYALAVDSREYATYDTAEEAAEAILHLAREHDLMPSITLLFEDDEII